MNEMKTEALKYMKIAQGQVKAAIGMLEEDRYCIDVSHQLLAAISLMKKANEKMLKQHMMNCVQEAFEEGRAEVKIDEVVALMSKIIE